MKRAYISEKAGLQLKEYLIKEGYQLCEFKDNNQVYKSISTHPDIFMCKINNEFILSKDDLGYSYPENVKYNGIQIGKYFVHNTDYTSPLLLKAVRAANLIEINVKQGYTKCNMVFVDEKSVITSDLGLTKALGGFGINVLTISQGNVKLEGFEYGFLGGASGKIGNTIIFNGNLSLHPDYLLIKDFIESRDCQVKDFNQYELEDIGSIFID